MMSTFLMMDKHPLQLLMCFVLQMPSIIELNLNYIMIDQRKLLTISRSVLCEIQANQLNSSPLNISRSINVE